MIIRVILGGISSGQARGSGGRGSEVVVGFWGYVWLLPSFPSSTSSSSSPVLSLAPSLDLKMPFFVLATFFVRGRDLIRLVGTPVLRRDIFAAIRAFGTRTPHGRDLIRLSRLPILC